MKTVRSWWLGFEFAEKWKEIREVLFQLMMGLESESESENGSVWWL